MSNYENMSDEVKEAYVFVIEKYLKVTPIDKDKITPEVAKIVDEFLKEMYDCTKRLKFFTNIFTKSSTIFGLVLAIGKEVTKDELEKAFTKTKNSICASCYNVTKHKFATEILNKIFL